MTVETYLLFTAPLMLLTFGAMMHLFLSHLDAKGRVQLQPVKRRRTLNS
jgi:hypothetical protein